MEGKYLSRNTHKDHKDCFRFEEHTHTLHTWGTSSSSWPCRNYVCSFCKREFKSAQALGGHMNVHRRDRARLRSSLSESPKPNPTIIKPNNPTHHLSDADYLLNSCDPLYGPCFTLSASSLSSPPSTSTGDKKPRLSPSHLPFLSPQSKRRSALGFDQELKGCASMEEEHKVFKNNNDNITLELGIGLLKHPKEKLDLELRLGF